MYKVKVLRFHNAHDERSFAEKMEQFLNENDGYEFEDLHEVSGRAVIVIKKEDKNG